MSEWHGDGTRIKKAQDVRRGDKASVDGNWLEVVRINPVEGLLQFLYLNGKTVLYRPDEEVLVR